MTDAHAKAAEAARAVWLAHDEGEDVTEPMITAYLAAMRADGWVMVRDCGPATGIGDSELQRLYNEGWDDARTAMLKGETDEQG